MELYAKFAHLNGVNDNGDQKAKYYVFGDAEGLEAFKKAQGEFFYQIPDARKCHDGSDAPAGTPVWNTIGEHGNTVKLVISSQGKVFADNTKLKRMLNLAKQHQGTTLGSAIDAEIAKRLLGSLGDDDAPEQEA